MILQLQAGQISAMWDAIKHAAIAANEILPAQSDKFLNNLLGNLLGGKAQAWVSFDGPPEDRVIHGVAVTCIIQDPLFEIPFLLVHSIYSFNTIHVEHFHEAMSAFEQYGKTQGCSKLVAMTTNERLLKLYKHLGMERELFIYSKLL